VARWWQCSSSLRTQLIRGALKIMPARCIRSITVLNVQTWIIGPALGERPLIERPADVLKVWPTREPIQRLPPAQFNPLLDELVRDIAVNAVADRASGFRKIVRLESPIEAGNDILSDLDI
jgi:hypothetical protein